jgi:hypothetical protein
MNPAPQSIPAAAAQSPTANSHGPARNVAEAASRAPIHLHIDRLVVEGLPVDWRQGGTLRAAVENELARLFRRDGFVRASSHAEADITGGMMRFEADASPRAIGCEIAQQVHTAIRHTRSAEMTAPFETGGRR